MNYDIPKDRLDKAFDTALEAIQASARRNYADADKLADLGDSMLILQIIHAEYTETL